MTRKGEAEIVLQVQLLPRGSGNRNKARALAETYRTHRIMRPHIKRVLCGASSVTVHFRASLGLVDAWNQVAAEERARQDVPGQMPLFGQLARS